MKWLDKLLKRKNTAPGAEAPLAEEKTGAPQMFFSEEPPLPWDAPTREKIRSSDYVRWYLTQVGAIERYAKTYRVAFILTQHHRIETVELPGSCGYDEALMRLETACLTQKDHEYRIQDWPHVRSVWGPGDTANQYGWLCEYGDTDPIFFVMDLGEARPPSPPPVLYGCPFASNVRIPDKSQRPVTVIRFGDEP